jgi:hypothetical protein
LEIVMKSFIAGIALVLLGYGFVSIAVGSAAVAASQAIKERRVP